MKVPGDFIEKSMFFMLQSVEESLRALDGLKHTQTKIGPSLKDSTLQAANESEAKSEK